MCISVIHHTNFNSGAQQENSAWGQTPASNGFCVAYDQPFRHPAISLHRKGVILEEVKRAQDFILS